MKVEFINGNHPLFSQVKQLGRKYAATLGFMPEGGFDDYAAGKCIITVSEEVSLMGYLMYREVRRFSRVAIVHLVVDAQYRHKGLHTVLLDALRDKYKDCGVQGLVLSCRDDYKEASAMWANYGFIARNTRRSRSLEKHYLTTWWYDFHQRDLFSLSYEENSKVRAMVDVNIIVKLRDAEKGASQLDPKEDPRCLLADWLVEETDLFYAPEVLNEIHRDENLERSRETKLFITGAFAQANADAERVKEIAKELLTILPGNDSNTRSDRKEVASCIVAGIPYFLTFDEDVIKKKQEIKKRFDVEIYKPQEFLLRIDELLHSADYAPVLLRGVAFHSIMRQDAAGLNDAIDAFLLRGRREKKRDFENVVMSCVNAGGEIYTVKTQEQKLAFYGVSTVEDRMNIHFLRLTDETLKGSLLCQIVSNVLQECVKLKRKGITILERHFDDKQKDSLLQMGYLVQKDNSYVKFVRDEVVSLTELSDTLKDAGLEGQAAPTSAEQMVRMEMMFFPLKIRDLDIPTYIIPIKAYWAGQLFDYMISAEMLFGAMPNKLWSLENVYYRHTRPITEKAPARILWYVSGDGGVDTHRKMIVGCSYLTEVHTGKGRDLFRRFKHFGIYEWLHIYDLCGGEQNNDIRALKFSHTELFDNPIEYRKAQEILGRHGYRHNTFAGPLMVTKEVFFDFYECGMTRDNSLNF